MIPIHIHQHRKKTLLSDFLYRVRQTLKTYFTKTSVTSKGYRESTKTDVLEKNYRNWWYQF